MILYLQNIENDRVKIFNGSDFAYRKIAIDRPGSGNTKNIGSVTNIEALKSGKGPFAELGEEVFDDYWKFYLTKEMAKAAELNKSPFTNLKQYKELKNIQ